MNWHAKICKLSLNPFYKFKLQNYEALKSENSHTKRGKDRVIVIQWWFSSFAIMPGAFGLEGIVVALPPLPWKMYKNRASGPKGPYSGRGFQYENL
jgi:hypothetical protein